jgi:glutamyl-tRNA synthetase
MSISVEEKVTLTVAGVEPGTIEAPIVPNDKSKGTRRLAVGPVLWISRSDVDALAVGVKVTLMHWGNVIIDAIDPGAGVAATWTDDRNFKGTAKINWILPDAGVRLIFREWNHLLRVPELPHDADINDAVETIPSADTEVICDASIAGAARGSIWQLERRGEVIIDEPASDGAPALAFFIPSGKAGAIGLPLKISLVGPKP